MTDSCNMHCPFCYVKQQPTNLDANKAITYIKAHQPRKVIFHGGEPLLRAADILQIMDATPEVAEFSITSNLMLPLTDERLEVIKRCKVATSYSIDRFNYSSEQMSQFKSALERAKEYCKITVLVTLSKGQLREPPFSLCRTLKWLGADYVAFERLRDDSIDSAEEYERLYRKTDEYLYEIFTKELVPRDKNVLLMQMERALSTNTPVFYTACSENVATLLTDGVSTTSCPNGNPMKVKKLRQCLTCDLFQFCKGDCPSFGKLSCSFPQKTFSYVKEAMLNGL